MCGIFFSIGFENLSSQVIDCVTHRGPDGQGWKSFKSPHGSVVMAHRRLSIIDLSKDGHQPMSSQDCRYWITYNGEIYNYLELRKELEVQGFSFQTQTDTEVLLKSFIHWGTDCLNKLNGMFAFVIWDAKKKKAFIARDRFGVKPLYYYKQGNKIAFASEIKQFTFLPRFKSLLNTEHFSYFLLNRHHPITKTTCFKNVMHIEPGNYAEHEKEILNIQKWYDIEKVTRDNFYKFVSPESFKSLFLDSIKKRLIADVQTGALLSGGLDSSSIVCTISDFLQNTSSKDQEIKTFTSYSPHPDVDESEFSDSVTNKTGIENIKTTIELDSLQGCIEKIIYHQEEPFISTSIHSEWNIYKTVKKHTNFKVVLDGQGADELLCGYLFMVPHVLADMVKSHKYFNLVSELINIRKNHSNLSSKTLIIDIMNQTFPSFLEKIQKIRKKNFIREQQFENFYQYTLYLIRRSIETQLRWQDRSSMAFSIESRQPFLDYRIVENLICVPTKQKFRQGTTKVLLRESMRGVIPEKVRTRNSKFGFPSPQKALLENIETKFFQKYIRKGENIIESVLPNSLNLYNDAQKSCLKMTTGLWAEKFGVSL